ncbi:MAG: hypothetical protein KDA31_10850 [Phycisphaerales bacterium]|nr:hypothetical protein [Phycisphaerales bacterium]MCB9835341.1 hypothetical protein [Phycisphaera sp.]
MHTPACAKAMFILAGAVSVAAPAAAQNDFASRVIDYSPAPGQFVSDPAFNDPTRALGAPVGGGTINPDLSSLVSLGGFGGSITLAFDNPVENDPDNPLGLDFIVFGNAFYVGANPNRRWAEAGLVEISFDTNSNGLADDAWFTIPGSALNAPVTLPLPTALNGPVLENTSNDDTETHWGYADLSPTLLLGDTDADNVVDDPNADPAVFYTVPDDPMTTGVDAGSGGGDAFDIAWAIDPITGAPANLPGFHFIRITSAVDFSSTIFGENSPEIDAVADVRPIVTCLADVNNDGMLSPADFSAWVSAFNAGSPAADQNRDGHVTPADFSAWVANYNAGCDA